MIKASILRMLTAMLAAMVISPALLAGVAHAASSDDGIECRAITAQVRLSPLNPAAYQLYGELCGRGALAGKTVQVLVPGFTYSHDYWDFPTQPDIYSYVRHAASEGYATFNIDRIGTGASAHPLSALVTFDAHIYVLHQVVQGLRSGSTSGTAFPKVVTVGHSAGAGVVLAEASIHKDTDAVIITGLLHLPNPTGTGLFTSLYPAVLDARFAGAGLDPGYLTTMPHTRASDFYNTAAADPAIIAEDELLKDTGSSAELATSDWVFAPTVSWQINVPVLLLMGQNDNSFCNPSLGLSCANSQAIMAREASYYNAQACLEAYVQPLSGHVINLHLNAPSGFTAASDWANRRVGPDSAHPATQPCL
ncbi:MAG TPA: alpha/beta fold hydrolase [Bacillota bacterium]|nr:alpha/beta fold hydrolase [Bacillota bacterium]